jgi:putative sigma-54 modulation protein
MNHRITGRGVKVTSAIRKKVEDMLDKHKKLMRDATHVDIELKQTKSHGGTSEDLHVEITIAMPKALIRVVSHGSDYYTIVDEIDPVLRRRLVRYHDFRKGKEGKVSWKKTVQKEYEKEMKSIDEGYYSDLDTASPIISRYKQFSRNSPMHPAEAIEQMELLGHQAFMFKNIETNKYSVVYRRSDGTYGLVEPKEA